MIDMRIAECIEIISDGLSEIVTSGFRLRKKNFEYIRKRGECIDIYCIGLHKMTGWYKVTPGAFLGFPPINRLFNKILQRDIPVNDTTFGFAVRNRFDHKRGNYGIKDDCDFAAATASILADFREIALPWFESIAGLADVDARMNAKNEAGNYVPQSVSDACLALIAAHLAGNPDFDEIADAYYRFMSNAQSEALVKPILVTRDYLKGESGGALVRRPST